MSTMNIYMISLKRDTKRREQMQQRFPRYYPMFHIIDAIDAKDEASAKIVKRYDNPDPHDKRRPLTTGEKCCSISHLLALQHFLNSGSERCIIIEDDIIGSDSDFDKVTSFLKLENPAGLTILGGQEGLINSRYLIGIQKRDYLWKLSKMARRFLLRTCCYSVDIKTAKLILSSQLNYLSRADNWIRILPINTNFFYIGKFKHPLESNESNLEPERKEGNLFKRAYRDGPTKIATNSSLKIIIFIITRLGIRKKLIEE